MYILLEYLYINLRLDCFSLKIRSYVSNDIFPSIIYWQYNSLFHIYKLYTSIIFYKAKLVNLIFKSK